VLKDLAVSQYEKFEQNYEKIRNFNIETLIIWGEDDQVRETGTPTRCVIHT
jgi:hypothetical protein